MISINKENPKILALFDVDGTLTPSRAKISKPVKDLLYKLKEKVFIGFVGGSDLSKQIEQLGSDIFELFDFCFSENGLNSYKFGKPLTTDSFILWIGQEKYNEFVNYVLKYLSEIDIPIKTGTFIEFRKGLINISPIGRNSSVQERNDFEIYDKKNNIRKNMIEALKMKFPELKVKYSFGGQISFDVFPVGWDKTYCLDLLKDENFEKIYFFGDRCEQNGNDYEIFNHKKIIGYHVKSPEHTKKIIEDLFF